jgi:hypothetical protein
MAFSEDSASSAAPFYGDGSIFDQPDVMLQAPTTTERVVDTQSGFLVVIKRAGERLALSCRRRVGTPPTSNILLTSDESLKLSKILASSTIGMDSASDYDDDSAAPVARPNIGGRRRFPFTAPDPEKLRKSIGFKKPLLACGVSLVAVVLIIGGFAAGHQVATTKSLSSIADSDPLAVTKIDRFSRMFVSDMLDFNPLTYKLSQVQAMSYMSPELLEKYWKETNFPLSRRQLKTLPQGTTVMINKINQTKIGEDGAAVDIFADLVRTETKLSNPVHIKLRLGLNEEGGIRVLEQEDLTAGITTPAE